MRRNSLLLLANLAVLVISIDGQTGSAAHSDFLHRLSAAAIERTHPRVRYEPAYVRIPYPGGDVPADTGVCADEVIRSYRALGVDLQKEVHEDMVQNFSAYPLIRGSGIGCSASRPEHRSSPRSESHDLLSAQRRDLADHQSAEDYHPEDIVTWDLGGGVPHIGIVVAARTASGRYMVVHNIGQGPRMEDVAFNWKITGHYRYYGPSR